MSDPKHPKAGDTHIDMSGVKLIDVLPEQLNKFAKVRDGYEKAVTALLNLTTDQLKAAGLHADDIARLKAAFSDDKYLGESLPAVEKLAEMMRETRQERRHHIATILTDSANTARRRADRSDNGSEILGPLQDLLDYQFGPAAAAVATRAKNAATAAAGGTPDEKKPEPAKDPQTPK